MNRQLYWRRLSRQVRWRLPKPEADAVLADYEELLRQRPAERDTALLEDLGTPAFAAKVLTEGKRYHLWLAAFGYLALCLLLPEVLLLRTSVSSLTAPILVLMALGMGVSLLLFHPRRESAKHPMPKGLLLALGGMAVLLVAIGVVVGGLIGGVWQSIPPEWYGKTAYFTLCLAGIVSTALGLLGLVKARIVDRRWSALYLLGLTVLALCVLVLALLTTLDMPSGPDWWVPYVQRWTAVGVIGLVGTGVSLC